MKIIRLLGLVLVAAMLSAGPAMATTYDAVTGFNATSNVAGNVWTYRAGTSGEPLLGHSGTQSGSATLNDWTNLDPVSNSPAFPNQAWVVDNNTNSAVTNNCCSSILYQPNTLSLDGQGVGSIVRFTAPTAGDYSITGLFEPNDTNMGTHNVGVIANIGGVNSAVLSATSLVNGNTVSFSTATPLTLGAGDYVDFISYGFIDGSYGNTGLQASLTTDVPEPPSLALLAVGLIGLIGIKQRYRRAR